MKNEQILIILNFLGNFKLWEIDKAKFPHLGFAFPELRYFKCRCDFFLFKGSSILENNYIDDLYSQ
jgi:hypothetical protein